MIGVYSLFQDSSRDVDAFLYCFFGFRLAHLCSDACSLLGHVSVWITYNLISFYWHIGDLPNPPPIKGV